MCCLLSWMAPRFPGRSRKSNRLATSQWKDNHARRFRRRRFVALCERIGHFEGVVMNHSSTAENFQSWEKFLDAYYVPIRTALSLIPFVGEGRADDVAQNFFLKMYERDILGKRPAITGRFRNWLYVAAHRHAIDNGARASDVPSVPTPSRPSSLSTPVRAGRKKRRSMPTNSMR